LSETEPRLHPAIGLLEFESVAAGIVAGDAMAKASPVAALYAGTVHPGRYLVLVDAEHRATQFNIEEGRPGGMRLELPSAVEDIAFSPGGSRVLFRTPRWVHRAGSSGAGLIWLEATLVPRALKSARIVFGDAVDRENLVGARFYLPVSGDGTLRLREFTFSSAEAPTMFGNKDELIAEWRQRLARSEEAPVATTED